MYVSTFSASFVENNIAILVDASHPYQLVPARTSWSILFTHTIGAFGHSAGTVLVR